MQKSPISVIAELTETNHSRDPLGLTYIYPVLSRRAGGISLGINLNPNSACNWACEYCQVENLSRGSPPPLDLDLLNNELERIFGGDLDFGPETKIRDIAFSGNGEPTACPDFARAMESVVTYAVNRQLPLRLITNGSLLYRPYNQEALQRLGEAKGEIWFKLDRATYEAVKRTNGVRWNPDWVKRNLSIACQNADTWIQTCWYRDKAYPEHDELTPYIDFLAAFRHRIRGILLYGLARPPSQGWRTLEKRPDSEMNKIAERLREEGFTVKITP